MEPINSTTQIQMGKNERSSRMAAVSAQNARQAQDQQQIQYDRMGTSSSILESLGALAIRASDPILSANERSILQNEANGLIEEFSGHMDQMNGQMNHTYVDGSVTYQGADGSVVNAALTGFDLSTPTSASTASTMVDNARQLMNEQRAQTGTNIGAMSRLERSMTRQASNLKPDKTADLIQQLSKTIRDQVQVKVAIHAYKKMQAAEKSMVDMFNTKQSYTWNELL